MEKQVKPPSLLRLSPLLKNGQSEAGWESQGKDKVGTTLTLKHKATPSSNFASKLTPIFTFTTEDFWANHETPCDNHLHYKALGFAFILCIKLKT